MTTWTAPDVASLRGDNSRPLQKIFGSLTEYLKDTLSQTTEVSQTYVRNGEATALTVGTVVYLDAQQGDRATVKRAFNTSDATSAKTLGVVAESIPANADGLVTTLGYLEKVNTSAFTAGQTLYLGATAGTFTATKPVAPNHMVYVGVVVRANAGNGIIYVRCQNGYELDEIHDVLITSPTTGNILMRNGSSLWINTPQTSITSVGTLTAGTIPTTLLSGSIPATSLSGIVDTARISGSYTGITQLGTISPSLTVTGGTGTTIAATTSTLINGTNNNSAIYLGGNTGAFSTGGIEASWRDATNPSIAIGVTRDNNGTKTVWDYGNTIDSFTANTLRTRINSSGFTVTGTGSIYLSGSTNAALTFANTPDTAVPWMQGPVLQGQTGWAFYQVATGTYRMGFRSGSSATPRYMWCNDSVLIGSQPSDLEVSYTLNVIGNGRFTSGLSASTFTVNNSSPTLTVGNWSLSSTWSAVEGYNGYLLLGNTSDRACYLRSNNGAAVNIGASGSNTLVVNNGNIVVNGTTVNSTLNVIGGTGWFSAMGAGSGPTVQNYFGFLVYVSSRRELKENIISILPSDGLDRILALRPVEFTMKPEYVEKANEYTPFDVKRGFIAQETAEVDHIYAQWGWVDENQKMATTPALDGELPLEDATPIYWNHDALIADLVASIQNIDKRLQQLETL